jgi:arylsulfatase A-like enzyme
MLPEVLTDGGFTSAAVVGNWTLDRRYGVSQGFEHFIDDFDFESHEEVEGNWKGGRFLPAFEKRARQITDKSIELLGRIKDQRFFLWLHYMDPHAGYDPPQDYLGTFSDYPEYDHYLAGENSAIPIFRQTYQEGIEDFAHYVNRYDEEIRYTDDCIGEVIAYLKANGLYENCLILFTADHGEYLGEAPDKGNLHFDIVPFFCHGATPFDGEVRVPMIVKLPDGSGGGNRIATPVSTVDILPTLAAAAGVESPAVQGRSFLDAILEPGKVRDRERVIGCLTQGRYFIWQDGYKFVLSFESVKPALVQKMSAGAELGLSVIPDKVNDRETYALFNLNVDRWERNNSAGKEPDHSNRLFIDLVETVVELNARWEKHKSRALKDGETEDALRNMGYVN